MVTKNIELSNPSKQPISYWVRLIGSTDDFSFDPAASKLDPAAGKIEMGQSNSNKERSIKIEPGQTIPFPIRFQSRISKVVKGKVIFTNKREGNVQAAAMVFELVSNVYERTSVSIEQKSTKLYKALPIELPIENIFDKDVIFSVQLEYEKNQPQGKTQDKKGAKGGKDVGTKKDKGPVVEKKTQSSIIPEPFTVKNESLKIKRGGQQTLQINFLPFELGIHKCNIILTDENVGEVQYTIIGKAELPEILDTFSGDCSSEEPYNFIKPLNYRNEKLEQARNQFAEKDRKDTKTRKDGNTLMNDEAKDQKRAQMIAAIH